MDGGNQDGSQKDSNDERQCPTGDETFSKKNYIGYPFARGHRHTLSYDCHIITSWSNPDKYVTIAAK